MYNISFGYLRLICNFISILGETNGEVSAKEATPSVSTKTDEEGKSGNGAESTESAAASTSEDPSPGEKRCV